MDVTPGHLHLPWGADQARRAAEHADAALDFESALRATLAVDRVLSVPQVLSLFGVIPDLSGLTRPRLPNLSLADPSRAVPLPSWLARTEFQPEDLWVWRELRDDPASAALLPLTVFEVVVAPVWNVASSVVAVQAISDWPMPLRYREHRVAHLLGAAQVRIDLGAPLSSWESDAAAVGETERPDAFWHLPGGGCVAIEYDTGAYSPDVIRRKIAAFERFDGVVWACSSDRRRRRLRRTLGPLGYRVIQVDWWSPRVRAQPAPGSLRAPYCEAAGEPPLSAPRRHNWYDWQ